MGKDAGLHKIPREILWESRDGNHKVRLTKDNFIYVYLSHTDDFGTKYWQQDTDEDSVGVVLINLLREIDEEANG